MTVTETALVVIAVCMVLLIVGAGFAVVRLVALLRDLSALSRRTEETLVSVNGVLKEGTEVVRQAERIALNVAELTEDASRVGGKVAGIADAVLDRVVIPAGRLGAVLYGVRAGLRALRGRTRKGG